MQFLKQQKLLQLIFSMLEVDQLRKDYEREFYQFFKNKQLKNVVLDVRDREIHNIINKWKKSGFLDDLNTTRKIRNVSLAFEITEAVIYEFYPKSIAYEVGKDVFRYVLYYFADMNSKTSFKYAVKECLGILEDYTHAVFDEKNKLKSKRNYYKNFDINFELIDLVFKKYPN